MTSEVKAMAKINDSVQKPMDTWIQLDDDQGLPHDFFTDAGISNTHITNETTKKTAANIRFDSLEF